LGNETNPCSGRAATTALPPVTGRLKASQKYLAPAGRATAVLKVRRGVVDEIGIGQRSITRGRAAQRRFLTSFR